jgi:hypothetical protein
LIKIKETALVETWLITNLIDKITKTIFTIQKIYIQDCLQELLIN